MADSNDSVQVNVTANAAGVAPGMREAATAVRGGVDNIRGALGVLDSQFGRVMGVFAAFSAALAGGAALKSFVNAALDATKEANSLAKALGTSATEASYMADAAKRVGVSSDTLITSSQLIEKQLLKNEDAFKKLGVATRDGNGHFRSTGDIMLDANNKLREFSKGVDRNIEGMKIYGKGWNEVSAAVEKFGGVTDKTREKTQAMGLVIGQEDVENMGKYRKAMMSLKDITSALQLTIGRELIPRLAEMGKWFDEIGPTVISVMRGAMAAYVTVQDSVRDAVQTFGGVVFDIAGQIGNVIKSVFGSGGSAITPMEFFGNVIKVIQVAFIGFRVGVQSAIVVIGTAIMALIENFRGLAEVAVKALKLDFAGAKQAAANSFDEIVRIGKGGMDKLVEVTRKGREDMDSALLRDPAKLRITEQAPLASPTGRRSTGEDEKAREDRMKKWEAALLEAKRNYMLENDMREMSLQDEKSYWDRLLKRTDLSEKEKQAIQKKSAEANFADLKRLADIRNAFLEEDISHREKMAALEVDAAQAASTRLQELGLMNAREALAAESDIARRRADIQLAALQERIELAQKDPDRNLTLIQQLEDQKIEIIRKSEEEQTAIRHKGVMQARANAMSLVDDIKGGFQSNLAAMLNGMQTFGGFMRSMLSTVLTALGNFAAKFATQWIEGLLSAKIAQTVTALAQVQSNAAVAASAAFASTAAIPIVGPELAPGAAAAAYAGTMSFAPMASARNGFDIPAGINPVTQLHEREMVLPRAQADAVRDMAEGKGGGGGGDVFHINAMDSKSFERFIMENGRALLKSLKSQSRNFAT